MRRVIAVLLLVGMLAAVGCAEEGEDEGAESSGPFAEVNVSGPCPSFLAVGVPQKFRFRIKNTGSEDWPATFVSFFDGLDNFVVANMHIGPLVGRKADTPGIETYRFGSGGGLQAGEVKKMDWLMVPKDAGNTELRFIVWGGSPDERSVPGTDTVVTCEEIAILP